MGIDVEEDEVHRTCNSCMVEKQAISSFIVEEGLQFAKESPTGKRWLDSLNQFFEDNLSYEEALAEFHSEHEEYEHDYSIIKKDVLEGRTDIEVFNYSIRDFLNELTEEMPIDAYRSTVAEVLCALMPSCPEVGYCQVYLV